MAKSRATLTFFGILLLIAALSSFTLVKADDSSKSDDHSSEKDTSLSDDSNQDDSKEKRSREEILFGNQQNRPSGLVDDLMGMSDSDDDETDSSKDEDKKKNAQQDQSTDASSKEDNDKRTTHQEENANDMMMGSGTDNWYSTVPVSSSALQYLSNAPTLHTLPSGDYANSLYDQEDLYRRKRQLLAHPLPLRKRRSLRSSLGQMIQKRGIRMPRRSMRLKRQVDMGDLLTLLGNDAYYDEQTQVPGHFSSYPETPAPEFRHPYTFKHRDNGILSAASDFDDTNGDNMESDSLDDIDSLMLLHPNARYVETPEMAVFPLRNRDEEREAFQKWLERHTTPNVFSVSRRSASSFYPMDYRYIPGYKKRSMIFSNGNRMSSNSYSGDNDDADSDLGKWGHVVQVPEAYASAEDVARLYGLANLMAEGDDEAKMRRSV